MIKIEDEASYTMAVEKFSDSVFRLACHYMPCREDAEDVTQEVFIKLLKKMNCYFMDLEHLKAWLFRVTKNQAIDHLRKQKKQRETHLLPDNRIQEPNLLSELQDLKIEDREILIRTRLISISKFLLPFKEKILKRLHTKQALVI